MFYKVELVNQRRTYVKIFELVTRSVTSFCATREFRTSLIL